MYYKYKVAHLLSLQKSDIDKESPQYVSVFRSYEGEVFENYIYEKLIRYAAHEPSITSFILKGPHKDKTSAEANMLSINRAGQIVYRTNKNEIGEFDAMYYCGNTLYFVEITLTSSVSSLRKRLRKKKALLEVLFPNNEIKALIILNEGVAGVRLLPDYCNVWITKLYSAAKFLELLTNPKKPKRKPFEKISGEKFIELSSVHAHPFKYYNTLGWILKVLRKDKNEVINRSFFNEETFIRYHELYTKIYLGCIELSEFEKLADTSTLKRINKERQLIVSIEKEHTGKFTLLYFMQHRRYDLDMIYINEDGSLKVSKKDPYGITVNEVTHITKMMNRFYMLDSDKIIEAKTFLDASFQKESK